MSKLILTRHGQSTWNAENRFTGWVDVDLSEKGKEEAKKSGELIRELNIKINISYTSYLKRAIETLTIVLKTLNLPMKFNTSWELNERHYGSLTGLNKEETKKKIGEEQFKKYRRSWDVAPPLMAKDSNYLENFSPLTTSRLRSAITDTITKNEPRVQLKDVAVTAKEDENRYEIRITYVPDNSAGEETLETYLERT